MAIVQYDSPFCLAQDFEPKGDQEQAISALVEGLKSGYRFQTLKGATGTGKTFTMASVIARTAPNLVRDWLWHPDNLDLEVVRFMMRHGVEDLPRSLLVEFARWYEAKRMSDRYRLFSFGDHLERIRVPMLVIAGARDRLTPPADLERLVQRLGSSDKTFWVAGHASGLKHEYSHVDLVLGRHAPDEVYPVVTAWLEAHRPGSRRR